MFQWDGKQSGSLGMGYHSCPCATELADLDGDGTMEMIGGSRIGGLHAAQLDGTKLWTFDMGAQIRAILTADVSGDDRPEELAGTRDCYVLCFSAEGKVLWTRNMQDAVSSMVVADVNADGKPEVVVGLEDGTVHVLDGTGEGLAVATSGGAITQVRVVEAPGGRFIAAGARDGKAYGLGLSASR